MMAGSFYAAIAIVLVPMIVVFVCSFLGGAE